MSKKETERNIGAEILDGIRSIKKGNTGRVIAFPPIAEIRAKTGLSQTAFAKLLGVSVRTLQEWEQRRRAPSGPAKTLLAIKTLKPCLTSLYNKAMQPSAKRLDFPGNPITECYVWILDGQLADY